MRHARRDVNDKFTLQKLKDVTKTNFREAATLSM